MAKLASVINEYVQKASFPTRAAEIADLSRLRSGIERKIYAVVRYVDQAEYRADEGQMVDKDFRRKFASDAVLAIYDDACVHVSQAEACEKARSGWFGELGELSLKVLCPRLFSATSGLADERLDSGEGKVRILDKDDLLAIVSNMDSAFFASIYYESIVLTEFARQEVERVKNSLQPTSTLQTQQTPQDSAGAGA